MTTLLGFCSPSASEPEPLSPVEPDPLPLVDPVAEALIWGGPLPDALDLLSFGLVSASAEKDCQGRSFGLRRTLFAVGIVLPVVPA